MRNLLIMAWLLLSILPIIIIWRKEQKLGLEVILIPILLNGISVWIIDTKITDGEGVSFFLFLFVLVLSPIYIILLILLIRWAIYRGRSRIRAAILASTVILIIVSFAISPLTILDRFYLYISQYEILANELLVYTDEGTIQTQYHKNIDDGDIKALLSWRGRIAYNMLVNENSVYKIIVDREFVLFYYYNTVLTAEHQSAIVFCRNEDCFSTDLIKVEGMELGDGEQLQENIYYFDSVELTFYEVARTNMKK